MRCSRLIGVGVGIGIGIDSPPAIVGIGCRTHTFFACVRILRERLSHTFRRGGHPGQCAALVAIRRGGLFVANSPGAPRGSHSQGQFHAVHTQPPRVNPKSGFSRATKPPTPNHATSMPVPANERSHANPGRTQVKKVTDSGFSWN
jgi:hypothetical protein